MIMDKQEETMEPMQTEKPIDKTKPSGMEIPVPLDSLSMPGEDDKMNAPAIGDPVQVQAEGTVTKIEGQIAFVSFKSINGKPIDSEAAKTTNTPEADESGANEFAQLQSEASKQPSSF